MIPAAYAWGVLVVYCVVMIGVGWYASRKTTNLKELLTGRSELLGPWIVAISYGATIFSMSGWVGNAALSYENGVGFLMMSPFQAFGAVVSFLGFGMIMRHICQKLNVLTIPDYFAARFKFPALQPLSAIIIAVFMMPYLVAIIKGSAVAFSTLMNIEYWLAVVILMAIVTLYMMYGGLFADMLTDMLQGYLMIISTVILVFLGLARVGGLTGLHIKLAQIDPNLIDFPGPLGWGNIIGTSLAFSFAMWGQPQVILRFMNFKDAATMKKGSVIGFIWLGIFSVFVGLTGLLARVLVPGVAPDLATVSVVTELCSPLWAAFFLMAGTAATMSTLDGVLLVSATSISRDLYQKVFKKTASDEHIQKVSQWAMAIIGIVALLLALNPPEMLISFTIFTFSVTGAAFVPLLLFSLWSKRTTPIAAMSGIIVGVVSTLLYYAAGQPLLAYGFHPSLFGILLSTITIFIVSKFTPPLSPDFVEDLFKSNKKEIDTKGLTV